MTSLGANETRQIRSAERKLNGLRHKRRHLWLNAFEHGKMYSEIAAANEIDLVQVYRGLAKAREESEFYVFNQCGRGDHDKCIRYFAPTKSDVAELCKCKCHQADRRGRSWATRK